MMRYAEIFLIVTLGAMAGMLMGGMFGICVGILAPGITKSLSLGESSPVNIAMIFGSITGIKLGGALACFSIIVSLVSDWIHRR